jgi:transcriptional regulator GlxA family with amidase domain
MLDRLDSSGYPISAREPLTIGFLLVPSFALLPYASAIEPVRAANVLAGRDLFRWVHIAPQGHVAFASNGVPITTQYNVDEGAPVDVVLVCAGSGVEQFDHLRTFSWLRELSRKGIVLGGISGGAYVLARAGVLDGYRCTIHWDHVAGFREEFPHLEMTGKLYEIDRDRITCSGGITPIDLMHELIEKIHGPRLATMVSDWFLHTSIRRGDKPQRMDIKERTGVNNERVLTVLSLMESHIEEPLSRVALAHRANISVRQLERLFKAHLGISLSRYYLRLRLDRAKDLLQKTSLSVLEVALASGFVSASHFSRTYQRLFGHPPIDERPGADSKTVTAKNQKQKFTN